MGTVKLCAKEGVAVHSVAAAAALQQGSNRHMGSPRDDATQAAWFP